MRAYWQLTLAQLRLFSRNRQMLFFSLLFPILLMVALGSFSGNSGAQISAVIVDDDGSDSSRAITDAFLDQSAVKAELVETREAALDMLKRGDRQIVVVVPAGYGERLASGSSVTLETFFDEKNMMASQLGVTFVSGVADGISKMITGYEPVITIDAEPVQSLGLKYIDFLVPGIVSMMIMSTNLNGVAGQISSWRERGVLRRMQSTTLKARTFISAQITARLLLNAAQAVIVLLIASLVFGTQVKGSWLLLLFYVVLGTLVFMSIGFIIAGVAKNPESAGPISGLISFPLMFLGNVFFPVRDMPDIMQPFVKALPITHLSESMREVMNVGTTMTGLWSETLILLGWLVVSFIVASLTFRWE
ncbi:ABC transporter permease [Paenibacillus thermotolerans]|uniref:ABC transporter permease n=1 Tax=Paenibacillus thermotolerans TaxID=3027807 RepID=UPI0023675602|nr:MULTISPECIES: ABC transporter permease [unclassified Paenibacillus]